MKRKKNLWLVAAVFCLLLVMTGCNGDTEEESASTKNGVIEDETKNTEEDESEDPDLSGTKAAFLIANGFHSSETSSPLAYLTRHGVECILIGPEIGEVSAYDTNTTLNIEKTITEVDLSDYDVLVIPGGNSPRVLNLNEEALSFVQKFMETDKPVATLCRGPYLLAGAGVLEGRTLTAIHFVENEIITAGGQYVDEAVVVDGNLITSRDPGDLPLFNRAIIEALKPEE